MTIPQKLGRFNGISGIFEIWRKRSERKTLTDDEKQPAASSIPFGS
jgi:hypothetical protein